jgi:hypothetical protein
VDCLEDSFDKKPEKRTKKLSSIEMEDIDEREIMALETTQVKMAQNDSEQAKEVKEKDVWDVFDSNILKALSISGRACRINFSIYILMIGFGVTLLVYSIIYSAFNGIEVYSTIFGSLGLASFVSILLIAPQSKISKNAANLAQLQILYRAYVNQLAVLWTRGFYKHVEKSMDEIERTSRLLEQVTFNTVDKIESLELCETTDKGQISAQGKEQNQ